MAVSSYDNKQPVVCVFCASSPGKNPAHLESARALGRFLHSSGYKLVYGGGTKGMMGEVAKTLVSLSGPDAVHGIIPRALIKVEQDDQQEDKTLPSPTRPKTERSMSHVEMQNHLNDEKPHVNGEENHVNGENNHVNSEENSGKNLVPPSEFGRTTIVPDMHTRKHLMSQEVENGGPGSGFIALGGGYGTLEEVMEQVTWNQLGIMNKPVILVNINGYYDGLVQWLKNSVREGFVGEANADILVEVKQVEGVVPALQNYKIAKGRFKLDWDKPVLAKKKKEEEEHSNGVTE